MRKLPEKPRRKVLRAKGFDYSTPGYYFVTVCVSGHELVFGDVIEGQMSLNDAGRIACNEWRSLPARFPEIRLDEFVVMPNHIHGLIGIAIAPDVAAQFIAPLAYQSHGQPASSNTLGVEQGAINCAATQDLPSLGNIIRVFKAVASDRIRRSGLPGFKWQANFYDHIVRNEHDLDRIRAYIEGNPGNWHRDRENPAVRAVSRE